MDVDVSVVTTYTPAAVDLPEVYAGLSNASVIVYRNNASSSVLEEGSDPGSSALGGGTPALLGIVHPAGIRDCKQSPSIINHSASTTAGLLLLLTDCTAHPRLVMGIGRLQLIADQRLLVTAVAIANRLPNRHIHSH
ncbi:hypothetical protein HaLaN_32268 [Haematococcus lacustris]|uniref:Uncharacterized protein n=1 Tax=Haematococcus lacustris TaxID=44745 RepID=A0A6A0AL04_HAELA|nr:hypothetical protein HaLaN_32268 [Haematococcus lacustris]